MEIRGVYYMLIKDTFPLIGDIVGPELGRHFEAVDAEAWYDAQPYIDAVKYLKKHISPEVMLLVGNELAELMAGKLAAYGIKTPKDLADNVGRIYDGLIRGDDVGEWVISDYESGRCVLTETGPTRDTAFVTGILKGGLGVVGAYNVRVTVLEDRANGAPANKYFIEWIEPTGG